jgi:hypothetical protein
MNIDKRRRIFDLKMERLSEERIGEVGRKRGRKEEIREKKFFMWSFLALIYYLTLIRYVLFTI